jgi:CubicO group peptidase (beta-lactamase class C family)
VDPFTKSTVCWIASMTKLMTSVAVMKCVEDGKLDLDQDTRPWLPGLGRHGIITGFDDEKNEAILTPDSTPISTRTLLAHTSGHQYEQSHPLLSKWRASRKEEAWSGPTINDKASIPLTYVPGTNFSYGAGHDWAGKVVEVVSGMTLEEYMRIHIWKPLGIEDDVTFFPKSNPTMQSRMAGLSMLNEKGEGPFVDASAFDPLLGGVECFGGAGGYASAEAHYTFLSAVFRRDQRLLKAESYDELFRPQLNEHLEQAFNDHMAQSPTHTQFLRLHIPLDIRMTWSFAGMVAKEGQPGRFEKGTVLWGGLPSALWFMDHEAGVCGTACCQVLPPMQPAIIGLHEKFQKAVYEIVKCR